MTVVNCETIDGKASGSKTFEIICAGVAPIASAASTKPAGTSFSEVSTCRPINGIDATTSGTIAAVVPIALPTRNLVSGIIATIKIMNGIERTALTTEPINLLSGAFSRICPFSVVWSKIPSGTPTADASAIETATM